MHSISRTQRGLVAALVVVLPAVLALAACSANNNSEQPNGTGKNSPYFSMLPADIQKRGTLNIASNVEYPPFESFASDNTTIVGIDRDLADQFEKQLGVKLTFANIAFDAIIPGLASERYDMAMSAMSDTVERQKQVDFVDYYHSGGSIMLPPDGDKSLKTLDDLCGKEVAIVKGTTEVKDVAAQTAKCTARGKPEVKSTVYPGQNEAVLAVQNHRADVGLFDYTAASYIAQTTKSGMTVYPPYEKGAFGIVFPKGSKLTSAFQKAMEAIAKDGTYLKILTKYGQQGGVLTEFPVNGITQ